MQKRCIVFELRERGGTRRIFDAGLRKRRVECDAETEGSIIDFSAARSAGSPCNLSCMLRVLYTSHAYTFIRDVGRASVKLFSPRDPFARNIVHIPYFSMLGPVIIIVSFDVLSVIVF